MPYSVPPLPPPVVNLLSPENGSSPVDATLHSFIRAESNAEPEFSVTSRNPPALTPEADLAPESASEAASLGQPLQVNSAIATQENSPLTQYSVSALPEISSGAAHSTQWNASARLPEVSALARRAIATSAAANVRSSHAPSARPVPRSLPLAQLPAAGRDLAAQARAAQTQAEPIRIAQVEPSPATPATPDQSLPFPPATPPAAPSSPAPQPPATLPAPEAGEEGGQILTIPTQPPPAAEPGLPQPTPPGSPQAAPSGSPTGEPPVVPPEVIELNADRQEYDQDQQVFRADGNAVMRFRQAILSADRIQVNLPNRIAVAEGNVVLTRGQQVLKGERFEYNFVQGDGTVFAASGELNVPAAETDFAAAPFDPDLIVPGQSVGDRVNASQPLQVTGSPGGINFGAAGGNRPNSTGLSGEINRLRYEAERVDFTPEGGVATNVRLTNDPFSPPELEIRTPQLTFSRLTQTTSELRARNPRVVFDRGLSLPLLRNRVVFGRQRSSSGLVQFGFDQDERGGFFLERPFEIVTTPEVQFTVTPQFLLQRAYDNGDFFGSSAYGLRSLFAASLSPTTTFSAEASLTSLDLGELDDNLRANVGIEQRIWGHRFSVGYTFRDRLFNGSLGFRNVQSNLGIAVNSPQITLGNSGVILSYEAGIQLLNAETDGDNPLLPPQPRSNNRINLTRYQAEATLSRTFYLWVGTPLPLTPTEGLRFTPNPVVPYVAIDTSLRGTVNLYSNGDTQNNLKGTIGLSAQFGHFSRDAFDYTALRLAYSQTVLDGESPFLFDRVADEQVLTLGITQQIIGPLRFGVQTSLSLDRERTIDTVYTVEYSRRTYAIALSFSPIRNAAGLTLRISDFNWFGDPGRFSGIGATPVSGGVEPPNN
ncbi:MAG TPA: DUF3769 domain-containing protein [Coleofasciculaceae cyanobacterium]